MNSLKITTTELCMSYSFSLSQSSSSSPTKSSQSYKLMETEHGSTSHIQEWHADVDKYSMKTCFARGFVCLQYISWVFLCLQ